MPEEKTLQPVRPYIKKQCRGYVICPHKGRICSKTAQKAYQKYWTAAVVLKKAAAGDGERVKPKIGDWVKWVHKMGPGTHCATCISLNNCWFLYEKAPDHRHDFCHCYLDVIPYDEVVEKSVAKSDFSKFDPYFFNRDKMYTHDKQELLTAWGYKIEDAEWMWHEVEKQGHEKYIAGDYELGKLDKHGQRINIRIVIPRKKGSGMVSFISGWMVKPGGHIQLNTPYGGK